MKEATLVSRSVFHDRFLQLFALGFVGTVIPYLVPGVTSEWLYRFEQLYTTLFMIPATMLAFQVGVGRTVRSGERSFWNFLTIAFGAWWLVEAHIAYLSMQPWAGQLELLLNGLYALFYICWFLALECRPHRTWPSGFGRRDFDDSHDSWHLTRC